MKQLQKTKELLKMVYELPDKTPKESWEKWADLVIGLEKSRLLR